MMVRVCPRMILACYPVGLRLKISSAKSIHTRARCHRKCLCLFRPTLIASLMVERSHRWPGVGQRKMGSLLPASEVVILTSFGR